MERIKNLVLISIFLASTIAAAATNGRSVGDDHQEFARELLEIDALMRAQELWSNMSEAERDEAQTYDLMAQPVACSSASDRVCLWYRLMSNHLHL